MTPGASVKPGGNVIVWHGAGVGVDAPEGRGVTDPLGAGEEEREGDGDGLGEGDGHGCEPMTFHE